MADKKNTDNRDVIIAKIAKEKLQIGTLERRNSDRLDFHDVHVCMIKNALIAAYIAGQQSGEWEPKGPTEEQLAARKKLMSK